MELGLKYAAKPRRMRALLLAVCLILPLPLLLHAPLRPLVRRVLRRPRCDFALVYTKPHKTAGTKIQADMFAWADRVGRPHSTCTPFEPNLQMRECVPDDRSGCAVVANHMVLTDQLHKLLHRQLGPFLIITSTRSGRERRLSHYLQINKLTHDNAAMQDLKAYLRKANPWSDYNYMTGEFRNSRCPLVWHERQAIADAVLKYDIVIDAELPQVSNTILAHYGLFQLSDSKVNVKGAAHLQLDEEAEQLARDASCVDEEMHRLFRIRMGSLYQKITGKPCLNTTKTSDPCF